MTGYLPYEWTGDCDASGNLTVQLGNSYICSITNDDIPGSSNVAFVTLHKTVINNNGGALAQDDFQAYVDGNMVSWDVPIGIGAGPHTVSEDTVAGYSASAWSGDCDAAGAFTAEVGGSYVCSITNDDNLGTLRVCKVVRNDDGGESLATDWTIVITDADGNEVGRQSLASDPGLLTVAFVVVTHCATFTLPAGTYTISEEGPGGYIGSFSGDSSADGTVTLLAGDDKSVTITNDDYGARLTVCKEVVINHGGLAQVEDFTFVITDDQGHEVASAAPASAEDNCVTFAL